MLSGTLAGLMIAESGWIAGTLRCMMPSRDIGLCIGTE
jgi:hypothetical protein